MTIIKRVRDVGIPIDLIHRRVAKLRIIDDYKKAERAFEKGTITKLRADVAKKLKNMPNGTVYPVYDNYLIICNTRALPGEVRWRVKGMKGTFYATRDARVTWKNKNAPKSKSTQCKTFKVELAALMKKHNVLNEWGVK